MRSVERVFVSLFADPWYRYLSRTNPRPIIQAIVPKRARMSHTLAENSGQRDRFRGWVDESLGLYVQTKDINGGLTHHPPNVFLIEGRLNGGEQLAWRVEVGMRVVS